LIYDKDQSEATRSSREEIRKRLLLRKAALWNERSSWDSHWQDIARHQYPGAGRFQSTDANRGNKKHGSILDNTPIFAHRTMTAGMMSGMSSPSRPWFRAALADKELMKFAPVRQWLHDVTGLMSAIFAASNTYNALQQGYAELGAFGTWACFVQPDFQNVIRHTPLTVGEYALGTDERGMVDTLCREFMMSVGQMVQRFGRENVSTAVRNLFDRGQPDAWVEVIHLVQPRVNFDATKRDNANMPFASYYYEAGACNDGLMGESGFKRFPALCPRWNVTGQDVYGRSPGMDVLGDVKQLQHQQLRKGQAIDYQVNPPLQGPVAIKNQETQRFPGGFTYTDGTMQPIRSMFEVNLDMRALREDIEDVRARINRGYYADLFMMLAQQPLQGKSMTATEVAERHEEKLLMLGPVLERLHEEMHSPLIDITFDRIADAGLLRDRLQPPKEIQGHKLEIEFVSTLAQAQRAVAGASVDRMVGAVGQLASMWPEARHKIDVMAAVDEYSEVFGVNPRIVVSTEVAQQRAAQEAQAAQAAQQGAAMAQAATSAKDLSGADVGKLQEMLAAVGNVARPAV
jgi:Bacteriophage head to tail connecting protein